MFCCSSSVFLFSRNDQFRCVTCGSLSFGSFVACASQQHREAGSSGWCKNRSIIGNGHEHCTYWLGTQVVHFLKYVFFLLSSTRVKCSKCVQDTQCKVAAYWAEERTTKRGAAPGNLGVLPCSCPSPAFHLAWAALVCQAFGLYKVALEILHDFTPVSEVPNRDTWKQ